MEKIKGIYALCDNSLSPHRSHVEIAKALLSGGVQILQLRMKGEKNPKRVLETARAILEFKKRFTFIFILNDFVELAAELPIDGVHVGQDDLKVEETRRAVGPNTLIGFSSHSLNEARDAEQRGADYVAFGAIFSTATKGPGHPIQGLEKLKKVVSTLRIPVVAIGGINRNNFREVTATGVAAIAMIGALAGAEDMAGEARWFNTSFPQSAVGTRS